MGREQLNETHIHREEYWAECHTAQWRRLEGAWNLHAEHCWADILGSYFRPFFSFGQKPKMAFSADNFRWPKLQCIPSDSWCFHVKKQFLSINMLHAGYFSSKTVAYYVIFSSYLLMHFIWMINCKLISILLISFLNFIYLFITLFYCFNSKIQYFLLFYSKLFFLCSLNCHL